MRGLTEEECLCCDRVHGTLDAHATEYGIVELGVFERFYLNGQRIATEQIAGMVGLSAGGLRGRIRSGVPLSVALTGAYSIEMMKFSRTGVAQ